MIWLCNPNNPTGGYNQTTVLRDFMTQVPKDVLVLIDEAYIDFGGTSALPLIEKYYNLLIVQTFSKSRSMAGMRIGYAM